MTSIITTFAPRPPISGWDRTWQIMLTPCTDMLPLYMAGSNTWPAETDSVGWRLYILNMWFKTNVIFKDRVFLCYKFDLRFAYNLALSYFCHFNLKTKSHIHSVETPSMVDPQWKILYWGSKWNLHTVWLRCGWLWMGDNLCLLWDYLCLLYP